MNIEETIWYMENAKWLAKELLPYDYWYKVIGLNTRIHSWLIPDLPRFGERFWLIDIWSGKRYDAYMNIKQYQISSLKYLYGNYPDLRIGNIIRIAVNPKNKKEVLVDFRHQDNKAKKSIAEIKEKRKTKDFNLLKKELKQKDIEYKFDRFKKKLIEEEIERKKEIIEKERAVRQVVTLEEKDPLLNRIRELEEESIRDKDNWEKEKEKEKDNFLNKIRELELGVIEKIAENMAIDNKKIIEECMIAEERAMVAEKSAKVAIEENKIAEQRAMVAEKSVKAAIEENKKIMESNKKIIEENKKVIEERIVAEHRALAAEEREDIAYQRNLKVLNEIRKSVDVPKQYKLSMLRHSLVGKRTELEEIKKRLDLIGFPTEIEDFIATKVKKPGS